MNLVYVFTSAGISGGSVQNKVINQIKGLRLSGINCRGLFFTTDNTSPSDDTAEYKFVKVPVVKKGYFGSLRQRSMCHKTIYEYFQKEQPEFDLIYFRYDHASSYLGKLCRTFRKKVFFEHVTAETEEIRLY